MPGSPLILPADFAAKLLYKANEAATERYGDAQVDNVIPEIFEVKPISQMNNGLYHRETLVVRDGVLQERDIGTNVDPGNEREVAYVIHKRRFFARRYAVPFEMAQYVLSMSGNALAAMESWASGKASDFGADRFEAEQIHAASFFNYGGYTAGHAAFDNSIAGVVSDPGGKELYDAVELFNLTGAARSALDGTTYYNAVSLAFSATNLETLDELVGDTNGWSELRYRMNTVPNLIVSGVSLKAEIQRVITAERLAGTANNDANPWTKYKQVVWPFFTDADGWVVGRAKAGLVWWQDDKAPAIDIMPNVTSRTFDLVIQSEFGAQVRPGGWRYWGASQLPTS